MSETIWLSIESKIHKVGEPVETYDFETEGKLVHKDGTDYITYQESDLSGMNGDRTMLKFKEGICNMHRYGAHKSELTFEEGKRHETFYDTPYGRFEMMTLAEKVWFDREAGVAELAYRLVIKGLSESRNTLRITIRRRTDGAQ